jgi:hypothetical protein
MELKVRIRGSASYIHVRQWSPVYEVKSLGVGVGVWCLVWV